MKASGNVAFLAIISLCLLVCCISCSGGLTEDVVPQTQVTTNDTQTHSNDQGPNETTGTDSEEPENKAIQEISIEIQPCGEQGSSRAYALLVYSLTDRNREVFNYDRYAVQWYGYDGALLSEGNRLECVAAGNYFVHVLDEITGVEARASITL